MTTAEVTNQNILEALNAFAANVNERFEIIEKRFTVIDQRFDQIDLRLSFVENQNRSLGYELRGVKQKVEDIDGRLMAVENDIKEIYSYLPLASS